MGVSEWLAKADENGDVCALNDLVVDVTAKWLTGLDPEKANRLLVRSYNIFNYWPKKL